MFEVVHVSDGCPAVGMFREDGGEEFFEEVAVGLVVAESPFFFDDVAFGVENLRRDFEGTHAVGFEPKSHRDVAVGDSVEVDGLIEACVCVGVSADLADELHVFFGLDVF